MLMSCINSPNYCTKVILTVVNIGEFRNNLIMMCQVIPVINEALNNLGHTVTATLLVVVAEVNSMYITCRANEIKHSANRKTSSYQYDSHC